MLSYMGNEQYTGFNIVITHCMACHCNERAPHGSCNRNHVVDDTLVLRVGDICNVEDTPHSIRQALQTATGLVGFGHQ